MVYEPGDFVVGEHILVLWPTAIPSVVKIVAIGGGGRLYIDNRNHTLTKEFFDHIVKIKDPTPVEKEWYNLDI